MESLEECSHERLTIGIRQQAHAKHRLRPGAALLAFDVRGEAAEKAFAHSQIPSKMCVTPPGRRGGRDLLVSTWLVCLSYQNANVARVPGTTNSSPTGERVGGGGGRMEAGCPGRSPPWGGLDGTAGV